MELICAARGRIRTTGVALEDDATDWLDSHAVYFASMTILGVVRGLPLHLIRRLL
jgi:hypothetical protein